MSQCGSQRFVQFNARIISAQAFESGAAPGSFWDAAVVHCPLLFVGGRAQLPAIGGTVTEIIRQFAAGRRAHADGALAGASTGARGS
jgi:hypothetical protein